MGPGEYGRVTFDIMVRSGRRERELKRGTRFLLLPWAVCWLVLEDYMLPPFYYSFSPRPLEHFMPVLCSPSSTTCLKLSQILFKVWFEECLILQFLVTATDLKAQIWLFSQVQWIKLWSEAHSEGWNVFAFLSHFRSIIHHLCLQGFRLKLTPEEKTPCEPKYCVIFYSLHTPWNR